MGSSDTLLQQAIAAVKSGRRRQARQMLLEYVQQDPRNKAAWLWLSDLVIDLEDKIDALENALSINPSNDKVQTRLDQFKRQQIEAQQREAAAREPIYQQIIQDIRSGRHRHARGQLFKMVEQNPQDERAWLLLSELLPEIEDQITALQNVLKTNPRNQDAQNRLDSLQRQRADHLLKAQNHERRGDFRQAASAYERLAARAASRPERSAAEHKVRDMQARAGIEHTGSKEIPTWLRVMRLTAGPPALFLSLGLVQSGLKPFQMPELVWLGLLIVLAGSVLAVIAGVQPRFLLWRKLFPQEDTLLETGFQYTLVAIGRLLTLVPFAWQIAQGIEKVRVLGQ